MNFITNDLGAMLVGGEPNSALRAIRHEDRDGVFEVRRATICSLINAPISGVLGALEDAVFIEENGHFFYVSSAVFVPFSASLRAIVCGISLAARRAVPLSLALRPILSLARITFAVFVSPIRHPVAPIKKGPRTGRNQLG
jgi:hypothetical protein